MNADSPRHSISRTEAATQRYTELSPDIKEYMKATAAAAAATADEMYFGTKTTNCNCGLEKDEKKPRREGGR